MKIRVEFAVSKSQSYPWVVRLCKKLSTYSETTEEGLLVHAVELDFEKDWPTFTVLANRISGWRSSAFYLDGRLMPAWQIENLRIGRQQREEDQAATRREYGIPGAGIVEIDSEHVEGEKN